jgi:hypothetical protein
MMVYGVYGIRLISDIPLDLPACSGTPLADIAIRCAESFAIDGLDLERRSDWYWLGRLPDGSTYARWLDVGEFLVSPDGRSVSWRKAPEAPAASFEVYLLGQALSFALVRLGFEPLHGTAVVIDGQAVAFLGDTGFGKSTLAAHFLASGAALLTDDLLLLETKPSGVVAHPGPARIKLIGDSPQGVPMNPLTRKQVLPVENRNSQAVPLRAVYVLSAPDEDLHGDVRIDSLSRRDGFVFLTANTFNYLLVGPERLERQVRQASAWIESVPVKRLTYPRSLQRLPEVRQALLQDLAK